ncbi:MAG: hypothetical protein C5S52_06370 [ANME-2 cluster archaeon]|nr:hypothetical protein [ANME-2 cluster archaeon]
MDSISGNFTTMSGNSSITRTNLSDAFSARYSKQSSQLDRGERASEMSLKCSINIRLNLRIVSVFDSALPRKYNVGLRRENLFISSVFPILLRPYRIMNSALPESYFLCRNVSSCVLLMKFIMSIYS